MENTCVSTVDLSFLANSILNYEIYLNNSFKSNLISLCFMPFKTAEKPVKILNSYHFKIFTEKFVI